MAPCPECGQPDAEFYEGKRQCKDCVKRRSAAWKTANPERDWATRVERRRRRRRLAIQVLGGVCVRCGFDDHRALQIDHVEGGGTQENTEIGTDGIVRRVLAGEPGYQLLCANCNWIKRWENDELPDSVKDARHGESAMLATVPASG